ncbi:MAG: hypothetical protein A4E61_01774 [Syntrophorhabdus sp. PtaB.Bin184]|jgi:hypothetical protein|nr:MAG: hypothetical protein A4E61_01774 [Syntrophorhabdus sp. PtaB.Bin184]
MKGIGKCTVLSIVVCAALCGCGRYAEVGQAAKVQPAADARYGKELEEIRKSLRGDIRIKLRKDGKGSYSWEITGKDAQEIIKADAVLTRRINAGKPE